MDQWIRSHLEVIDHFAASVYLNKILTSTCEPISKLHYLSTFFQEII